MNHTTNLHLPQWEETDRIQMDDFNDAMASIDAGVAAAGNCKIVTGTYTGTGEYGEEHPNTLTFEQPPKCVIVAGNFIMIAIPGADYALVFSAALGSMSSESHNSFLTIRTIWNGNTLQWYSKSSEHAQCNSELPYSYIALLG